MNDLDLQVLERIWDASTGDYVFLPRMRDGVWHEGDAYTEDAALNMLAQTGNPVIDQYFTPLLYVGPQRRKGMLGNPGVIYADLDGNHDPTPALAPSIVIDTSAGHAHAYWLLEEPVPPMLWEGAAKAWTYEIGADPGGWDATQVLRVPGTTNYKASPVPVSVRWFHPDLTYPISAFPRTSVDTGSVVEPEPVPSKSERDHLIYQGIEDDTLPLSARYWLTAGEREIASLGSIDRSKVMWSVEKALLSARYTPYEVFHLMYFSGINKWRGRPDRLWHEVNKAAGA